MSLELQKNERGYYLDIKGKPVHFENNPFLFSANTKLPLTNQHIQEIFKCSQDIIYFSENYVKIFTLDNGWVIPKLRDYQYRMINSFTDNRFTNVMAGRQSGKSISTAIYLLWEIIFHPDTVVGIAANKDAMAKENLNRIKEMYESLPIWLKVGIKSWNKTYIMLENGSKVYSSATSGNTFRGMGISILWVDEVAFIKKVWDEFSTSVVPTISSGTRSKVIYTTTPKGLNHWYYMWKDAEEGKSTYNNVRVDWWEVPGRDIEWRNDMIKTLKGGEVEFNQEYGIDFIGSSYTLVEALYLKQLKSKEPIIRDKFISGMKIFKEPINTEEQKHNYVLICDTAKDGTDAFAIQVIDIQKFPFEQVASANLTVSYLKMPNVIYELAQYYNFAYVVIENVEGSGQSIVDTLYNVFEYENLYRDKGKDFYGFRTHKGTRPKVLSYLKTFIENGKLHIHDQETIDQLNVFVRRNGKYQADESFKDDLVMALALGFAPFLNISMFEDYQKFLGAIEADIDTMVTENKDLIEFITIGVFDDGTQFEEVNNPQFGEIDMWGVYNTDMSQYDNFGGDDIEGITLR
jgi:hypothetical protein